MDSRPSRPRALLASGALGLLTACGTAGPGGTGYTEAACMTDPDGYTVCEPSGYLPPGATPPPPPVVVEVDTEQVGGVRFGTEGDVAVRRLTELLGEPDADEEGSCLRPERLDSLAQPLRGREVTWDGLRVYLTQTSAGRLAMTGWHASGPRSRTRVDVRLPYGTAIDGDVEDVLDAVPGASGRVGDPNGPDGGTFAVTSDQVPGVTWSSYDQDGDGPVDEARYDPEGCG